jgi:hypothetical protein
MLEIKMQTTAILKSNFSMCSPSDPAPSPGQTDLKSGTNNGWVCKHGKSGQQIVVKTALALPEERPATHHGPPNDGLFTEKYPRKSSVSGAGSS